MRESTIHLGILGILQVIIIILIISLNQSITNINEDINKLNNEINKLEEEIEEEIEELSNELEELEQKTNNLEINRNIGELREYEITKYTAGEESTGKRPGDPLYGITASGKEVQRGHIAMNDNIPFGTKVYIPYFDKIFIVKDRGGAIGKGDIDIYISDRERALEFGRRKKKAKIIEWGE